jgi:serine phosphatase RsbU (regulator of sigma subunit)
MLGVTLLNEQFRTFGVKPPEVILGHLRNKVKEILAHEGAHRDQKDGIDMSIAIVDREKRELLFAGANRPLYFFRKTDGNEYVFSEIKGDRQPIGIHWEETAFTSHRIELQPGDTFYMFTDGYVDQYGGELRKKFKSPNFRKLLLGLQSRSLKDQRKEIEVQFDRWRRNFEQIDDVCVFGWRILFSEPDR